MTNENVEQEEKVVINSEISKLRYDIAILNQRLRRQHNLWYIAVTSILRGLFSAIGATLVFALMATFIVSTVERMEKWELFKSLFTDEKIEQMIDYLDNMES